MFKFVWTTVSIAVRERKKDVTPTLTHIYANIMPLLWLAKAQCNYGGSHFTNLKTNAVSTDENLIELSEYIETLIGEDDWCG